MIRMKKPTELWNRREFFRSGARYLALGVAGAVTTVLVRRGAVRLPGQNCTNDGICRGCRAFEDCGLPQALSAKQVMQNRRGS